MNKDAAICRPMIDLQDSTLTAIQLNFYSDASACKTLGMEPYLKTIGYLVNGKLDTLRNTHLALSIWNYMYWLLPC